MSSSRRLCPGCHRKCFHSSGVSPGVGLQGLWSLVCLSEERPGCFPLLLATSLVLILPHLLQHLLSFPCVGDEPCSFKDTLTLTPGSSNTSTCRLLLELPNLPLDRSTLCVSSRDSLNSSDMKLVEPLGCVDLCFHQIWGFLAIVTPNILLPVSLLVRWCSEAGARPGATDL